MGWRAFRNLLHGFRRCETGAAIVEFAALAGAVGLTVSGVVGAIGGEVTGTLASVITALHFHAVQS